MDKYNERLVRAFKEANGIKSIDTSSKSFQTDFDYWFAAQESAKQAYLKLLKHLNIDIDSIQCIEIGKGKEDSIGYDLRTTMVSPYFEKDPHRKGLTLIGNPVVVDDTLKYETGGTVFEIPVTGGKIYLAQNVFDMNELSRWKRLARDNQVVVGAYGSVSDLDMNTKVRELKKFARRLDDYVYDNGDISGTYCYAIVSKKLTKSKN